MSDVPSTEHWWIALGKKSQNTNTNQILLMPSTLLCPWFW